MWWPELDFQVLVAFIYMTGLPGMKREHHWALRPTSACKTPPGFTSLKGVLSSLSGWRNPITGAGADMGSRAGWGECWEGGQGCGCPQGPNALLVRSSRKGGGTWLMFGQGRAEFGRVRFSQGHASAVIHISTRRKVICKNTQHVAVAKPATHFFQKKIRPQVEYGI